MSRPGPGHGYGGMTGEEMVCISLGQSHPLEGYNLKEIPVYFHKKKTGGYYVDVKEAIENNL